MKSTPRANVNRVSRKRKGGNIRPRERKLPSKKENWRSIVLGVLLVVLTVAAYWPALRGGFIWDDDFHLTENPCIVGPMGFRAIWTTGSAVYYPLVLTSFWIQHALWGLNPLFFHLVNVFMHALSAVLLWRVLLQLKVPAAFFGAAIWALHPVQVESVAWITELKNTQSCAFYLLAILFFLKWRDVVPDPEKRSKNLDYALAIFFAVLAILSKTSTVMLPAVLALCWWWRDRGWRWRNAIWLLPFLIVSVAASTWTVWEQEIHSGAQGAEWAQSGFERVAIAGKAVWFYLGKLLWPRPLIFIYPRWKVDGATAVSLLPAGVVVVFWVIFWLGRNKAWSRSVFFAFTYFLISLFPVMGFFNVYFFRFSFVGDHFQYLASMGIIALVAASLSSLPKLTQMPSMVLLLTFLVLTWRQTTIYRNQETLWRDTLAKNPAAWMAHDNLGVALASQGRLPEAIQNYEQALQLNPDYAEAYNDLGVALASQGRLPEAIEKYEQAIRIKPDYVKAYYNQGNALTRQGKLAEAIQNYERAIQLEPDYADAYYNLGNALASNGKLAEAIQNYGRAIQLKPDYAEAYSNLGVVLSSQGKLTDAIRNYERAIQLKPNYVDALNNLAYTLATSQNALVRNGVRAIALSERANQLTGRGNPVFLGTLAAAYAEARRYPEAVETISRAIEQAGVQGNFALVSDFESQLRLYKAHAAGDAR